MVLLTYGTVTAVSVAAKLITAGKVIVTAAAAARAAKGVVDWFRNR